MFSHHNRDTGLEDTLIMPETGIVGFPAGTAPCPLAWIGYRTRYLCRYFLGAARISELVCYKEAVPQMTQPDSSNSRVYLFFLHHSYA
jgi:hypothetical protein